MSDKESLGNGAVPTLTPSPAGSGLVPPFLHKQIVRAPMIAGVAAVAVLATSPLWFHPHAPDIQQLASARLQAFGSGASTSSDRAEAPDPTPWPTRAARQRLTFAPSPPPPQTIVHTAAVASVSDPVPPRAGIEPAPAAVAAPASDPPAPTRGSFPEPSATPVEAATASIVGYAPQTSRFEVQEGAVIHARLLTHVDSEQPGHVSAEVIEPLYSSVDRQVEVIPAGTQAQGVYSTANAGQTRLIMVWTRLNFPDGRKFDMGPEPGTDELGGTGQGGTVNSHLGKLFGQALLYTALNAAGQALSHSSYIFQSSNVTQTFAGQQPRLSPTIYLDPPARFDIGVVRDLPLDRYEVRP